MPPILLVLSDLGLNGAARQASLVAPELVRAGFDVHVAAPGRGGPFADALQAAGVPVHRLGGTRRFDPVPLRNFIRLLAAVRPTLVHAWRTPALRIAGLAGLWPGTKAVPLLASDIPVAGERLSRFDRWLLQRARRVELPLAVAPPGPPPDRAALLAELGLPADARVIACAGAVEPGKGFREAAWTFEILEYIYPTLWLLVIGDGSERGRVEAFSRSVSTADHRVRFVGTRTDVPGLLQLADLVWICGSRGGRNVALEALANGRPVVAADRPDLRALLGGAATFAPGDSRHEFARAARRVLDGPPTPFTSPPGHTLAEVAAMWAEQYRALESPGIVCHPDVISPATSERGPAL